MGPVERLWTDWTFQDSLDEIVIDRESRAVDAAEEAFRAATGDEKLDALPTLTLAREKLSAAILERRANHEHYTRSLAAMLATT